MTTFVKGARAVHRWTGAVLSLLVIVVSLSGVVLLWQVPINRLIYPQAATGFDGTVEAAARVALAAEQAFGADGIAQVTFGDLDFGVSEVTLRDQRTAFIAANGELVGVWGPNGRWDDWLVDAHHRLLGGRTGLYVVGFGGLLTLMTIVAGCIAFWPARGSWRKGVVPRAATPQALRRSHRNVGIVLSLPIAGIIVTGVALSFPQTAQRSIGWTYENAPDYGDTFGDGVDMLEGAAQATWPNVFRRAADVFPGAVLAAAIWPTGQSEIVIQLRNSGDWTDAGSGQVQITAAEGYMDLRIDGRHLPPGERAWNAVAPVHTGAVRGWVYQALETGVGLGLLYLGVIGLMSFLKAAFPRR